MRAIASLLLVGLFFATPVLAQTEQETTAADGLGISSTVRSPSLVLESWTPTLAPPNAAELMIRPLAEQLAFAAADTLPRSPAPTMKTETAVLLGVIIAVVVAALIFIPNWSALGD